MAGNWPATTTALSTANFDSDTDLVTGSGNARDNLKDLIDKFNIILAAVDASDTIYTVANPGQLFLKNVTNLVTVWQDFRSHISVSKSLSTDDTYLFFRNSDNATFPWKMGVSSTITNNAFILYDLINNAKIIARQDGQTLDLQNSAISYGTQTVQMKRTNHPISFSYSANQTSGVFHNKGSIPDYITLRLRCTVAEWGYTVGDVIDINSTVYVYSDSGGNENGSITAVSIIHETVNQFNLIVGNIGVSILDNTPGSHIHRIATGGRWAWDIQAWWWPT